MEVKTYLFAAAKLSGVLGAVKNILKNNPQLKSSIISYAKWIGPLARKRDGTPLLPVVIGEAMRAYRSALPDISQANMMFRKMLVKSGVDCAYNHYIGEMPNGNRIEWDISYGNALDFMDAHPEVTKWKVEIRPFLDNKDLSDEFLRAFAILKTTPPADWADMEMIEDENEDQV